MPTTAVSAALKDTGDQTVEHYVRLAKMLAKSPLSRETRRDQGLFLAAAGASILSFWELIKVAEVELKDSAKLILPNPEALVWLALALATYFSFGL